MSGRSEPAGAGGGGCGWPWLLLLWRCAGAIGLATTLAALTNRAPAALAGKPSVAVLPFANLGDEAEDGYFADGMTDDLITDLAKVSGLVVIARNSVFAYKGRPSTARKSRASWGSAMCVEGSVRRAGDRVRINAQLIDVATGSHLWADRFDRSVADVFAVQDEVIGRIVEALAVELTQSEQVRVARLPTDNLEAYDYYLRAEQLA